MTGTVIVNVLVRPGLHQSAFEVNYHLELLSIVQQNSEKTGSELSRWCTYDTAVKSVLSAYAPFMTGVRCCARDTAARTPGTRARC